MNYVTLVYMTLPEWCAHLVCVYNLIPTLTSYILYLLFFYSTGTVRWPVSHLVENLQSSCQYQTVTPYCFPAMSRSEFRPPWESRLPKTQFNLFRKYGNGSNLLLQDRTTRFIRLDGQRQTYAGFLGAHIEVFQQLGKCPVPSAGFCVVSSQEYDKCQRMRVSRLNKNCSESRGCFLLKRETVSTVRGTLAICTL